MKKLLIIGARGFGREIYGLALACIEAGEDMCVKGFLDDKMDALEGYKSYPPIISPVEVYEPETDDVFICALGDVSYKKHYVSLIQNKGGQFISLIHPTASIGLNTTVGEGCIIAKHVTLSCDVTVGNFVTISAKAGMGHDSRIGNWGHIGAFSNISGFVSIGKEVTIHPYVNIIPHRVIGDGAVLGTGSVVITNVKSNNTVFGNPAKKIVL